MPLRFRQPIVMIWPAAFTLCGLLVHVALSIRITSEEPTYSDPEPHTATTDLILLSHGAHADADMLEVTDDGPTIISAVTSEELAADAAEMAEVRAAAAAESGEVGTQAAWMIPIGMVLRTFAKSATKVLYKTKWKLRWQADFKDWIWDLFDGSVDEGNGLGMLPINGTDPIPSSWRTTEKRVTLLHVPGWWGTDLEVTMISRCWFNGDDGRTSKKWVNHCALFQPRRYEAHGHWVHVNAQIANPDIMGSDSCAQMHYSIVVSFGQHWVYDDKEFHHVIVDGCTGAQRHLKQKR